MRYLFVIIGFLFISGSYTSKAQTKTNRKEMVLLNLETQKTNKIREKKWIRVWAKDDNNNSINYKGRFNIVNDSTIEINSQKIRLNDIVSVGRPFLLTRILGGYLFATGVGSMAIGGVLAISSRDNDGSFSQGLGEALVVVGGVYATAGALLYSVKKNYINKSEWKITIAEAEK